jgi:hypothetical protein
MCLFTTVPHYLHSSAEEMTQSVLIRIQINMDLDIDVWDMISASLDAGIS